MLTERQKKFADETKATRERLAKMQLPKIVKPPFNTLYYMKNPEYNDDNLEPNHRDYQPEWVLKPNIKYDPPPFTTEHYMLNPDYDEELHTSSGLYQYVHYGHVEYEKYPNTDRVYAKPRPLNDGTDRYEIITYGPPPPKWILKPKV
jgi:hypothetical protein